MGYFKVITDPEEADMLWEAGLLRTRYKKGTDPYREDSPTESKMSLPSKWWDSHIHAIYVED